MTQVVWQGEENARLAQSEKNARCGHTREKKKRAAKSKTEVGLKEDNATNRAAWGDKITSYNSDPR